MQRLHAFTKIWVCKPADGTLDECYGCDVIPAVWTPVSGFGLNVKATLTSGIQSLKSDLSSYAT